MMNFWIWFSGLVGNNRKAVALIFVFILLLILFAFRVHAQPEVHLQVGRSFGCLSGGPVLGLELVAPLAEGLAVDVGTTLWGRAGAIRNNWDWHARLELTRGSFGAALGPAYLKNIDAANGSHAEMSLMLFWRPWRLGADLIHLSNAGTSAGNCGRNATLLDGRLR